MGEKINCTLAGKKAMDETIIQFKLQKKIADFTDQRINMVKACKAAEIERYGCKFLICLIFDKTINCMVFMA